MVLAVAVLADALPTLALEVDRGGIEEHQVQAAEQVLSTGKQRFFNQVLRTTQRKRCRSRLLVHRQRLAQPAHGPVEVLQFQILGAMAEFERNLIRERVRMGLRNARSKGKKLGRPIRLAALSSA